MSTEIVPDHLAFVGQTSSQERAQALGLALASQGISSQVTSLGDGWAILVAAGDRFRAANTVAAFEQENPEDTVVTQPVPSSGRGAAVAAAAVMASLAAFHAARTGPLQELDWLAAGSSRAAEIRGGAWERAITGITLHADINHVLANFVLGTIFLAGLFLRTGPGIGMAMVVISGAAASLANAVIQGPPHDAIGFSGAVFAAVGALAGLTLRSDDPRPRSWLVVVGAAVALAALFGTGAATDVLGHFLGLVAGLVAGLASARWVAAVRYSPVVQLAAGSLTVVMVVFAWWIALGR